MEQDEIKKAEKQSAETEQELHDGSVAEETEAVAEETATDTESRDKEEKANVTEKTEEDKVQEMGEKLAELDDRYKRLYADFENFRRRTMAEKAELILNGSRDMAKEILPVVDDMERALSAMKDEEKAKEGVKLIYDKLMGVLAQKGVKPMNCKGEKFNAELHEAISQIPAPDESKKNEIIDEILRGYYLNDKVLRHAKVVVAI